MLWLSGSLKGAEMLGPTKKTFLHPPSLSFHVNPQSKQITWALYTISCLNS